MANIELGNLYDMNKSIVSQVEKELSGIILYNKIYQTLNPYITEEKVSKYYMLLCNELHDFTVFHFNSDKIDGIYSEFAECLINRGKVFAIDNNLEGAVEVWLQNEDSKEMHCYFFFSCDEFIVEV